MRIFYLAVIVIVLGMATASISLYLGEVNNTYNLNLTETQFSTFKRINETHALGKGIQERVENQTGSISGNVDIASNLLDSSLGSIKLMFSLPGTLNAMIVDGGKLLNTYIGIPPEYMLGLIALVLIVLGMGILTLIFKVKP